jgi:uncharacterized protein (DUF362 family)
MIMTRSRVAILKTNKDPGIEEIHKTVRQAVDAVGGMGRFVKSGDLVIIKPNLVISMTADTGTTTDWRISKAVADLVKAQGARPVICESCGTGGDTEKVFQSTGYGKLRDDGYEVVDLKKVKNKIIEIPEARVIKKVKVPKLVTEANVIINVPKLKTHDQLIMTGALKNMKGAIGEKEKNRLHKDGLNEGVADINLYLRPSLTVVDGIIGQEGLGPVFGDPVEMNLILAADDMVAVDTVQCHIMEMDPDTIDHIKIAEEMGLGTMKMEEIELIGTPIDDVKRRFKLPDEDLKKVEVPGFQMVLNETSCTGCRNTMYSVIKDMQEKNLIEHLHGITAVVGEIDQLPDVPQENLVLVGACTAEKKVKGLRFAKGCPPRNYWVIEAICGTPQQSRGSDYRSVAEK